MRPARVLHVAKVKGIGGCERHLLTLLPCLSAAGLAVRLLVLEAGEDERRFVAQAWDAGIDMERAPAGADGDPRAVSAVSAAIRRFSPDVVHTHLIHADLWGQLAARRAGVARRAKPARRDARVSPGPGGSGGTHGGSARDADHRHLIVRGCLRAHGSASRRSTASGLCPTASTSSAGQSPRRNAPQERQRLELADEDVVVGMASRLIDGKGHAMALDAVRRARRSAPAVAGCSSPVRARCGATSSGALSAMAARASFLGQVDDVPRFMGACDVLLFPTLPGLGEGFGLAALEAMAAGVPVVATDVGALPEVVEDGVTGSVVAPRPEMIAAALGRLAGDRDERVSMGKAGRERAATIFGLDAMVARTVEVYREATT